MKMWPDVTLGRVSQRQFVAKKKVSKLKNNPLKRLLFNLYSLCFLFIVE